MGRDMNAIPEKDAERKLQTSHDPRQEQIALSQEMRRFIRTGARVIQQMQPVDQAGWHQTLATVRDLGFDVSDIPPQYDPDYAAQVVQAAQVITSRSVEPQSGAAEQAVDLDAENATLVAERAQFVAAQTLSCELGGCLGIHPGRVFHALTYLPENMLLLLHSPEGWSALADYVAAELGAAAPAYRPLRH